MEVISKMICTVRHSANTQKLEGWWDKQNKGG
jgi:hypothetical protein